MNNTELTEDQIREIEEFIKNNPDDATYILALSRGNYGWIELPNGNITYIKPPSKSSYEIGEAFRKVFENIQREDNEISKILKQVDINLVDGENQQMKSLPDILEELSLKWNDKK